VGTCPNNLFPGGYGDFQRFGGWGGVSNLAVTGKVAGRE